MNDKLLQAILNNEELKDKIAAAQSKEECMELIKEYSAQLTEGNDNSISGPDNGVLSDDILAEVSGGFDIEDHILTYMRCNTPGCGYIERRIVFWVAVVETCPRCKKESLHGTHAIIF